MNDWIAPGSHIAALGADKSGDQELDPMILQPARIFVDDIRQCRTDGEINVPLRQGLIKEQDIASEIGEVITRRKPERISDVEITLFDSTGIALQDSATVPLRCIALLKYRRIWPDAMWRRRLASALTSGLAGLDPIEPCERGDNSLRLRPPPLLFPHRGFL